MDGKRGTKAGRVGMSSEFQLTKPEPVVYCLVFLYAVYFSMMKTHGKRSRSYLLGSHRINNGCKLGTLQCRISSIILSMNHLKFHMPLTRA